MSLPRLLVILTLPLYIIDERGDERVHDVLNLRLYFGITASFDVDTYLNNLVTQHPGTNFTKVKVPLFMFEQKCVVTANIRFTP